MTDCLFCKIAAGQIHILIIPRQHIAGPSSITENDERLIGRMMRVAGTVAAANGIGNAYRLVLSNGADAGQLIWPPG